MITKVSAQEPVQEVKAVMVSDSELAKAARLALRHDKDAVGVAVRVKASNGWVALSGEMDDAHQRECLVREVGEIPGVQGVSNLILIRSQVPAIEPEAVKEAIERVLEQQADREARQISVAVDNGTVVLTGNVQSWDERCAIIGAASHAPGVLAVTDHLHFKSPA